MSFKTTVDNYMKGIQFPSVGAMADCPDCGLAGEEHPTQKELVVASQPVHRDRPCECCGGDPGYRYPSHGLDPKSGMVHMDLCVDCVIYLAHGDLPDVHRPGSASGVGDATKGR